LTSRVAITGAAGFIGSRVAARRLDAGAAVLGIDDFDPFYPRAVKEAAVGPCIADPGFALWEGDVRDVDALAAHLAAHRTDVVIHCAARAGVRASFADRSAYVERNVRGTAAVLEAARRTGVQRIVLASSSSVYGDAEPPFGEDEPLGRPQSPYAATKQAGERLCALFARRAGMRIAMLRFFSVYGPGQRPDQAIARFTAALVHGGGIEQYGAATSARDYTHVDDVAAAVDAAAVWTGHGAPAARAFNVGTGCATPLGRIIALVAEARGGRVAVRRTAAQPGDVHRTQADVSRAAAELGWRATITPEAGIPAYVHWYEVHHAGESRAAS